MGLTENPVAGGPCAGIWNTLSESLVRAAVGYL